MTRINYKKLPISELILYTQKADMKATAVKARRKSRRKERFLRFLKTQWVWWLMLLPGILLTAIFKYGSMFGIVMAFQDFDIFKGTFFGQEWASSNGFGNFLYVFQMEKLVLEKANKPFWLTCWSLH